MFRCQVSRSCSTWGQATGIKSSLATALQPASATLRISKRTFVSTRAFCSTASYSTSSLRMSPSRDPSPVRVLVAGGAYAGLTAAINLVDLGQGLQPRQAEEPYTHHPDLPTVDFEVTVVDERDGFVHLIGMPLAMADAEYAKKPWLKFSDIPAAQHPNLKFVQGSVSHVDCAAKTATVLSHGTREAVTHAYDFFVNATGLRRVWPTVPSALAKDEYLRDCEAHVKSMEPAPHGVVVVGGGAVGIEMAAELAVYKPEVKVTLVHSRNKLLSSEDLPDDIREQTLQLLKDAGVDVVFGHRLDKIKEAEEADGSKKYEIHFTNGEKRVTSKVINAISKSTPSTAFLPSSALDEEGYVKILPNLNFQPGTPNNESHYCAGDAKQWSGIRRCGGALMTGCMVAQNIHQRVVQERTGKEAKLLEISPVPPMIALAVGKNAISTRPGSGTRSGPGVMERFFQDDLGFQIVWRIMSLGDRVPKQKM